VESSNIFGQAAAEHESSGLHSGGPADPIENPIWTLGDVVLVTLGGIAFFLLLGIPTLLIFTSLPALAGGSQDFVATVVGVIAQTFTYIAVIVLINRVVRTRGTSLHQYLSTLAALRWNPPRNRVVFAILGVVLAILFAFTSRFLPVPPNLPIEKAFSSTASAYITMVFGITIAPLFEEIYFRGLVYPVLVRAFRRVGATLAISLAVTITAALFAAVHANQLADSWAPIMVIFFVGIVLTLVRAQTRSLASSWIVHLCYNTTLFVVTFVQTSGFRKLQ
jgi:membrane protease YdiL (CAAX protease family)